MDGNKLQIRMLLFYLSKGGYPFIAHLILTNIGLEENTIECGVLLIFKNTWTSYF